MICSACNQTICIKASKQSVKCKLYFHGKVNSPIDGLIKNQVINVSSCTIGATNTGVMRCFCISPKSSKFILLCRLAKVRVCALSFAVSSQSSSCSVSPLAGPSTTTYLMATILSKLEEIELVQTEFSTSIASNFAALETFLTSLDDLEQLAK